MTQFRTIGILGGMGPEATVLLQQRLIEIVSANDDSDHIPLLVDMNTQVPSRIKHLIEKTGEDPGPTLAMMAKRLENAGAKALAMPCNTAHYYAEGIASNVSIPFLDMIDAVSEDLLQKVSTPAKIGILASPATQLSGLFDLRLSKAGFEVVWPQDGEAQLSAIREIKKEGVTPAALEQVNRASDELLAKGAQWQIIGCSEFSLLAGKINTGAKIVDSLDCLVARIIAFARAAKGL